MSRLKAALDPQSVAIIGASDNPNKVGGRPVHYLDKFGFKGKIFPINPSRPEVQGHKCYPSLADLPEAPEMVIVAVAGDNAIGAVEDCAAAGVKIAVVMASGFGEVDAVEGKAKERRMVEVAHKAGMRIVGPNSQGLANFGTGAIASFSTMFMDMDRASGHVAMLSQSGALSTVPVGFLRQKGIGVRHTHATGNDSDITVGELACAVAEDSEVKLMLLYLESIPDKKYLEELAAIALDRDLPIVALKSGRTEAGKQAAQSHTGALANEDRVVDAFLADHGIWRAQDMRGLVEATELYLKGWKPQGRRLVAISNSGAVCVMTADAATSVGMPMAQLAPATDQKLKAILPSFATTTNPIDLTAALLSNSRLFGDILPVIAEDPAADAFLIGVPVAGPGYDVEAFARDSAAFARQTGKPLVVAATQPSVARQFAAEGASVFPTEVEAVTALHQFLAHRELMARTMARRASRDPADPLLPVPATTTMLNEADSLALLAARGIAVVAHRLCRSRAEAIAAFETIGGPVVVKGCSADIAHKSELGLVRLGIKTREEAGEIYAQMEAIIRKQNAAFDGVIIAAMAGGRREVMIGAHRDPVFGPTVVVGDGGKYVEIFADTKLLLPPFTTSDVRDALATLRIAPLLSGVRGEEPMDIDALCDAVVRIGNLMRDPEAGVMSIDLNPVMLNSAGQGCVVVDAVVFKAA
ncbi:MULTISPECIES: acetate--CoA ligase family protein [Rhodopseudomonas]|uniref:CoA-binding protein n=1 Tax=Rhodopseudomonas palustris TaxID=1076 RepID=A0A0D7EFQ8_RHOPL|nr:MULTISPECIES: acetate--CoA ligase family protein [Rhodopseudomonas]KIZ39649.1 CoA-binding protein [Rhodopseudomonas palustris]MDF3809464.1 acetate--CoA ligase family protein [Rhodopseudomonas sp. BAL398]WOK18422.1 acetate--CoA ligase family protein [Rhodopseudomonas sp. BAL398]